MAEWQKCKIGDIAKINENSYSAKDSIDFANYLDTGNITQNVIDEIQYIDTSKEKLPSRAKRKVKYNSIIYSTVRPNQLHYGIIKEQPENFVVSTGFAVIDVDTEIADADYIYYFLTQNAITDTLQAIGEQSTSAYPSIKPTDIADIEIILPELKKQKGVSAILSTIDGKIKNNTEINNNLEQQLEAIFENMFGSQIDTLCESDIALGDLIKSIDNRGKTPPLEKETTSFPIIDVKALSGNGRIVNYNNCSKYVSEDTYNSWFRSGHPAKYDILLSTVGSVAEMKLFLGDIGCIAQNVVALRCNNISPLYMYQYLKYIKSDLVAYNIGSVQPSIKVTHIIKHPIYLPTNEEILKFHDISEVITLNIYNNIVANENLSQLRDSLLPKLMSGELDVTDIDI